MVTAAEVTTYLTNLYLAQASYMEKLALKEQIAGKDLFSNRAIAAVLNCYVKIITDYFAQNTYSGGYWDEDYNFFDVEEIKEIIFRINKICDINYYLDL